MRISRYEQMFSRCAREQRGAFIPFVVVGDPDMKTSVSVMKTLVDAGADALELGIPFSDPVADGPIIQAAVVRALQRGATPGTCLEAIREIREQFPEIPIGILTYANVMYAGGMGERFRQIGKAGVDSVLTADMPIAEASDYLAEGRSAEVDTVFIAPPDIDDGTLRRIAESSRGYTYVVTRRGVTGCGQKSEGNSADIIRRLAQFGAPPPVMGFGISTPAHVQKAMAEGAAGAISGSAVVEMMSRHAGAETPLYKELAAFVQSMKQCTAADAGGIEE